MNRRHFLKSAGTAVCLAGMNPVELFANIRETENIQLGEPRLKFGILSDTHIVYNNQESLELLRTALEFFKESDVDAVLIAGDIVDDGLSIELEQVMEVWRSVFPKNKGLGNKIVEKLFVFGNHDSDGSTWESARQFCTEEESKKYSLNLHRKEYWKKILGEDYSDIFIKDVKGYKFIGAHAQFGNLQNYPGLKEFFDSHEKELDPEKPFFYFQHSHPLGTCSSPWVWGHDDGTTTKILSNYPNCVAFSGHSHTPISDERTIWQKEFTSIGTGSLRRIIPFGGRENSEGFESMSNVPAQMPEIDGFLTHNGQIMTVYDKYIQLDRYEMVTRELFGQFIFPVSVKYGTPFSFEERESKNKAPQFNKGAMVKTSISRGEDRNHKPTDQMTVSFPVAVSTSSTPRAFDYEVQLEYKDADTIKICSTKRVYSGGYHLGEKEDAKHDAICVYALSELPTKREFRFVVRPCECFGKKGNPIVSDWLTCSR